jgi:hypothetical protein
MRRPTPFILIALACFLGGCPHAVQKQKVAYDGPTDPMVKVVEDINRNNQAIPSLWASLDYTATVVDDRKREHTAGGGGALLYKQQRQMRLIGTVVGAGTVFEVGSTNDRFWLLLKADMDTMWWGHHRNVGKPCVSEDIPIRPELVVEVLGVATIDTNFNTLPVPVMRFDNERDAYVFVWNAKLPDRWVALKEVWYDRQTKQPTRVLLYDVNGRVILRAFLSNHKPVEIAGVPKQDWPVVATHYWLSFPDNGTRMQLDLDQLTLDKRGTPTRRGIDFPQKPGVGNVIQVDEACEGE